MITPDNQPKPIIVPKPWNMETFSAYLNRTIRKPLLLVIGLLGLGLLIILFGRFDSYVIMQLFSGLPYIVVVLFGYILYLKVQYRRLFWSEYAKYRGWTYLPTGRADVESAMMFHQGNRQVVTDVINGTILNHPLTLCNYKFNIGYGKNTKTHSYTVVIVTFTGKFPHVYVDRLDYGYGLKVGRPLPLPTEAAKQYKIFAPLKYEIEALAIFDPETLAKLLDLKFNFDMELIDQKLYVFIPQMIDSKEVLEQRLHQAEELLEEMIPHLDRTNYHPIPNMPDRLK